LENNQGSPEDVGLYITLK